MDWQIFVSATALGVSLLVAWYASRTAKLLRRDQERFQAGLHRLQHLDHANSKFATGLLRIRTLQHEAEKQHKAGNDAAAKDSFEEAYQRGVELVEVFKAIEPYIEQRTELTRLLQQAADKLRDGSNRAHIDVQDLLKLFSVLREVHHAMDRQISRWQERVGLK